MTGKTTTILRLSSRSSSHPLTRFKIIYICVTSSYPPKCDALLGLCHAQHNLQLRKHTQFLAASIRDEIDFDTR